MLTNDGVWPAAQLRASLAMLDFVAKPEFLSIVSAPEPRAGWKSRLIWAGLLGLLVPCLNGCNNPVSPTEPSRADVRQARRAEQSKMDTARQDLEQIPPPSKNRYLSVRSKDAYANPFLVVHPQTVTLTIIYKDQDPDGFTAGGVLRPASARKQEIDVRVDDLPRGLAALPPDAWPYGRVVAIEESPVAPRSERVAIRRNVEATIQILNDLGVVVDEWTGSNGALLR